MSQLRLNPLNGRWVTIVAERRERPTDFAPRSPQVEADTGRACPFCPGTEHETPLWEASGPDGNWQVQVVANRYPAFFGDDSMSVRNLGPVHVQAAASGIHEVLILSPEHAISWGQLDDDGASQVMHALAERMGEHARLPHIRYTQAIVNHGREAGASVAHPHGQLLGMPFVPGEIIEEERAFGRFDGGCILCTTVEAELNDRSRVIYEDDNVIIVCPFWSGCPFEMLVIPRSHVGHLDDSDPDHLTSIGIGIKQSLADLEKLLGDVSYNLVFHSAPHQHHDSHYHWHAHIFPKLTTVAGFERGTGVMINITPPEDAAAALQQLRVVSPAS
jgi:UDPglucose--hexose-1-phosphate uridylyltransferase